MSNESKYQRYRTRELPAVRMQHLLQHLPTIEIEAVRYEEFVAETEQFAQVLEAIEARGEEIPCLLEPDL